MEICKGEGRLEAKMFGNPWYKVLAGLEHWTRTSTAQTSNITERLQVGTREKRGIAYWRPKLKHRNINPVWEWQYTFLTFVGDGGG
jgi:hypothetical protein